jgi:hypothetical protein
MSANVILFSKNLCTKTSLSALIKIKPFSLSIFLNFKILSEGIFLDFASIKVKLFGDENF